MMGSLCLLAQDSMGSDVYQPKSSEYICSQLRSEQKQMEQIITQILSTTDSNRKEELEIDLSLLFVERLKSIGVDVAPEEVQIKQKTIGDGNKCVIVEFPKKLFEVYAEDGKFLYRRLNTSFLHRLINTSCIANE